MSERGVEKIRALASGLERVDMPDELAREPLPDHLADAGDHDGPHPDAEDPSDPGADDPGLPPPGDTSDIPPEKLAAGSALDLNDVGNAERLILYFGEDLLWLARVGWHVWTSTLWDLDGDEIAVRKLAQRLCRIIWDEASMIELPSWQMERIGQLDEFRDQIAALEDKADPTEEDKAALREARARYTMANEFKKSLSAIRAAHRKFARSSGNTQKIAAALKEASVNLARRIDDMDRAVFDVNTPNAVLRFTVDPGGDGASKTALVERLDHDRAFLMTKITAASYDPAASAPRWNAFLERVQPVDAIRRFLKRYYGLCLTAFMGEQVMLWNHGHGANGKSLINEIIATVMGSYAGSIDIKVLTGEDKRDAAQATPDLMLLPGRRFIRTSEPERETPLQEAKIKRMTGQDPLQVRALNQDFVEVKLIGKLVVSGNHLPKVIGDDDGIWRRLLLVNWSVQIPEGERDHDLLAKIVGEEASGVLNWLVEGCIEYLEEGLNPPKEVRQWVEDFRRDSDEIGDFLTESTLVTGDPEHFIKGRDLVEAVQFWQRDKGGTPYLARTIENKLKQQKAGVFKVGGKTFNAGKQGGQRGYFGLRFTETFDELFRAARAKAESRRGGSSSEAGI